MELNFANMKPVVLFLLISIITASCNQPGIDHRADETAIRRTDSTWSALAKQGGDVNRIASYWADDAVVIAPGQPVVKGKEALKKMVADSKNIPGFSISWKSSDIQFSPDGKLAYMSGENLMTMDDLSGRRIDMPGRGYTIWRKESNGDWKCVVDIWNNPPSK
jgi:ketosteroid isomerase-like protein